MKIRNETYGQRSGAQLGSDGDDGYQKFKPVKTRIRCNLSSTTMGNRRKRIEKAKELTHTPV
jgi:hypothetical protein